MIIKEKNGFRIKGKSELDDEKSVNYYFPNDLLAIWSSLINNNLFVKQNIGLNGIIIDEEFYIADDVIEVSLIFWDILIEDNYDPDIYESFKKYNFFNCIVLINLIECYFSDYLCSEVKEYLVKDDGWKISFPLDPEYAKHFRSLTMPDIFFSRRI